MKYKLSKVDEEYKQKLEANKRYFLNLIYEGRHKDETVYEAQHQRFLEVKSKNAGRLIEESLAREMVELLEKIDYRTIPSQYGRDISQIKKGKPLTELDRILLKEMKRAIKKGPKFYHRNIPIYSMDFRDIAPDIYAFCFYGRIFVNENTPERLQPIFAEHELGEIIVGHTIGRMMEVVYAEKKGRLKEFIKYERRNARNKKAINQHFKRVLEKGNLGEGLSKRKKDIFNKFLRELKQELKRERNRPQLLEYESA